MSQLGQHGLDERGAFGQHGLPFSHLAVVPGQSYPVHHGQQQALNNGVCFGMDLCGPQMAPGNSRLVRKSLEHRQVKSRPLAAGCKHCSRDRDSQGQLWLHSQGQLPANGDSSGGKRKLSLETGKASSFPIWQIRLCQAGRCSRAGMSFCGHQR